MALTGYPFPYDLANLLGGRVRWLYAPAASQAIPDSIDDVIEVNGSYTVKGNWLDFGASKDAGSYSRGFDTSGYEIQQLTGNVIEEVTDVARSVTVSMAEIKPEHLRIIENAPSAAASIAAGAGISAQKRLRFGSFTSLTRYRVAGISQRPKEAGLVTESSAATRGRFVMVVLNQVNIAADDVELEQAKGELSAASVTFTAFPEPSGTATGEEYGAHISEDVSTIT